MKRALQGLVLSLACGVVAFGVLVHSFPREQAGCLQPSSAGVCWGSGIYIGHGIMLTNQHIAVAVSEQSSFSVPAWKYLWPAFDVGVERVLFLDRDIELGIIKLNPSILDFAGVPTPCLSTHAVKRGETLIVTSSPNGKFPPVSATLVVSDARPLMRLDPFPRNARSPYSAMTIITTLSSTQAGLVAPGSSGGPVLNSHGELVGLVWTGREFNGGQAEVWITPVSSWFSQLQAAKIPKGDLQAILESRCSS